MQIPQEATLLRVFLGESDRWEHQPLYEAIVLKAREAHLAGATVLRGPLGFGKASRLHTAKILRLSTDLPMVIEIVDSEEKINAFLPMLETMIGGGLVTLEKVKVIHYQAGDATGADAAIRSMTMNDIVLQVQSLLQSGRDRQAILLEALQLVLTALSSETGTIHRLDLNRQLLHLTAQIGLPPFMLDVVKTIPVGKGIAGETVVCGGPVTMCNLQTDTSGVAKPGAKQTGVGGALCVPIRQGDTIVGTIGVGTKREYEYTPEETRTLESIGRLLGEYLDP